MERTGTLVLEPRRTAVNPTSFSGDKIDIFVRREASVIPSLVVSTRGRLDYYNAGAFQAFVHGHLGSGPLWVVLDLAGLVHLASSGINTLVELADEISALPGEFVLISVPQAIRQTMDLLGLGDRLPVYLSLKEAFDDLGQPQRHRRFRPVFPLTIPCPSCARRLQATRQGKYRCATCKMPFQVDDRGRVGLV